MPSLATWVTSQLVFNGVVDGLVIGLLAVGLVLVYRATRVINFAVGNLGLVGASLLALMVINYGVPFWLAAPISLLVGTLFAIAIELAVIRRLFTAPRVVLLVATIGISGLALAVVTAYPDIDVFGGGYPVATDHVWSDVLGVRVTGPQLAILVVVPIVTLALGWVLNHTLIGKTVQASAENPDLARVNRTNPKVVSTFVWAAAGFVATLTMILVAGVNGSPGSLVTLGPSTLVRALTAAVIASLVSFPRAMLAGVAIGVAQALIGFNYLDKPGLIDALLFVVVLVAVALQSRGRSTETQTFSFAPKVRAIPDALRGRWWVRWLTPVTIGALFVVAAIVPFVVTAPSKHLVYATIACFAICGLSLTVVTGWGGQLSLGQMAFAGIGALLAASLTRGLSADLGVVDLRLDPLPFALSIVIAAAVTGTLAALIGIGALRVRGLLLAVSTFAFAVAAQQYAYRQPLLSGGASSLVSFRRGSLLGIDLTSQRTYYLVVLAGLAIVLIVVSRLRDSGIGRTTIAVRDNADSAAAYTVRPAWTTLRAFALAGAIAGFGGALLAGAVQSIPFTERYFLVADSLVLVSIVVIGGLSSPMGAVLGSLWVIGLPTFFPDNNLVPLFTSSLGLLVLLLYFPGGFVQIAYAARDALLGWVAARVEPGTIAERPAVTATLRHSPPAAIPTGVAALATHGVGVRFGGNRAVDGVSIVVQPGEIVGLIGTNGAGKSTLMNAIGGFVPAEGRVELAGRDITALSAPRRAAAGLGRTFQAARLFPELTVRETLAVALEARGHSSLTGVALLWPPSTRAERRRRAHADELIAFLGLGRYADVRIADLSTGTRRIVELAGLLAVDARVLCLDEPTAGVAQRETEAFGPLLQEIRRELDASVLIIEHDMPLIMSISDRVYCLEVGRVIAEGVPATVRNDPGVIASYLGTATRAIDRSDAPDRVSAS